MFVVLTNIRLMNEIQKPKSGDDSAMSIQPWEYLRQFEKQKNLDLDGLIQVYREHWRDESWHEVLCLMARMLDAKFTSKILEYLIGEDGEGEKFSNLFLAAQCVSEVKKRNDIAAISSQLCDEVKELTQYGNITDTTSQEYYNLLYEIRTKAVAAVAATWKNDPETLPWLKERALTDDYSRVREAAVQELARGWKDDPETLPWLKERARTDDNLDVRLAAVKELARGWKDDPETLPILKESARTDDYSRVREAAVQELARGWKNDQKTLPWLKERARTDHDWEVRSAAVQELALGWKDDPKTLPWIKQLLQSDDNSAVRQVAVQEVARGWKDDPKTLLWLKERARSDDNWNVRSPAVQELARGWKDDPELFELLCDVAINDPFERQYDWQNNPRQVALSATIELYADRPQTLELVRDRAQNDSDQQLREFAQQKLAELEGQ